jgi:hypothetical protein
MTELIVAFRKFVNAPKNATLYSHSAVICWYSNRLCTVVSEAGMRATSAKFVLQTATRNSVHRARNEYAYVQLCVYFYL